MSTNECSWRLWPAPGMEVVTSIPLGSRTRATLRSAEFGFFGVWVKTRTQTPRFCGLTCSAGLFVFVTIFFRPWRTSRLMVGMSPQTPKNTYRPHRADLKVRLYKPATQYAHNAARSQPARRFRPED